MERQNSFKIILLSSFLRKIGAEYFIRMYSSSLGYQKCVYMYFNISRAIKHLLDVLTPHSIESGGLLKLDHVVFIEGRGNLIIEYTPEGANGEPSCVNFGK